MPFQSSLSLYQCTVLPVCTVATAVLFLVAAPIFVSISFSLNLYPLFLVYKFYWWAAIAQSLETRYEPGGPGIESRWGRDFPAPVQIGPGGPPILLYNGYRVFPGGVRPGRGVTHPI